MKCEIIRDLLPSYIDGLTSEESNYEIEEHLKSCRECDEVLGHMKMEINFENPEVNKKNIKPFKKLNRRVLQAVLITLASCILIAGAYAYFFVVGWKVDSEDMNIKYSYQDGTVWIDFELKNGKVLTAWSKPHGFPVSFTFTECYHTVLDNRGKYPNEFSYGVDIADSSGNTSFTQKDRIILHFKDKTETLYLKDIAEELGIPSHQVESEK